MNISLSSILDWFSSLFTRWFSDQGFLFAAKKVLYYGFLTITLPIVIKNTITDLFVEVSEIALSYINSGGLDATIVQFSGVGAWLADKLMLQDCLAIILTAVVVRFKLSAVPFFR